MKDAFRFVCFLFVLFLSFGATDINVNAADSRSEVFAVDSVEVKQTGQNAFIAKEKALSIAMTKSFRDLLVNRFNLESKKLPSFSSKEISDCVYDSSINSEKYSDSIYICEALYRFDGQKTAALLQKHGIKSDLINELVSNIKKKQKKYTRIAVYADDFIKLLFNQNLIVEDFSSKRVIFKIRTDNFENFKKIGIRYAQL